MTFSHRSFDGYEQVLFCHEPEVGLHAIIAIHDTSLGPAAGGCRMQPYPTVDDALDDVLRLAQGMTYKNAMAGLPLGGGKCVVIADPGADHKADLLRAFSHHVQALGGRFWTAIDVGVGPADTEILAEHCDYIFANASRYPTGFNPSSYTALGGLRSIQAAAMHRWGDTQLVGRRVAVQGLGAAGSGLARHLCDAGAELVIADIRQDRAAAIAEELGAAVVDPAKIHAEPVDIFAPCALGGVLNPESTRELRAEIVCGLANNQLADPAVGVALAEASITYVPDYVANAGGIAAAGAAIYSDPTSDEIAAKIDGIYDTVLQILRFASDQDLPTSHVADELARSRILAARQTRGSQFGTNR